MRISIFCMFVRLNELWKENNNKQIIHINKNGNITKHSV